MLVIVDEASGVESAAWQAILEINAAAFESKIQTADMICALANKYGVSVENIVFDGSGNTGRDIMKALERRYPYGLIPYFGSKPGGRFYTNARTACAAALARRLDPQGDHGVKSERKREEEKRQAEYWAKRPMAQPWKVAIKHPPSWRRAVRGSVLDPEQAMKKQPVRGDKQRLRRVIRLLLDWTSGGVAMGAGLKSRRKRRVSVPEHDLVRRVHGLDVGTRRTMVAPLLGLPMSWTDEGTSSNGRG